MKEKLLALNVFHRTFVISFIVSLLLFVLMIPLMIFNLGEIPFGLLLGEFISYMSYFVIGFIIKSNPNQKSSNIALVIVLVVRVLILAGISVLSALLYYRLNHHIFNVIAIIGGYLIPLIVLIVIMLKERKEMEKNV